MLARLWNGKAEETTCAKVTKELNWKKKLERIQYVWSSRYLRERSENSSWKRRQGLIMRVPCAHRSLYPKGAGNSLEDSKQEIDMIPFTF